MYNQNMYFVIQTREAFESHLRGMAGLEFMVVQGPTNDDIIKDHNGIWVISKQQRSKRPGMGDEVVPLSTYYVVGENIYMAPTVASVVESRLASELTEPSIYLLTSSKLSTVTALAQLFSSASKLPTFSPSLGHIYIEASSKPHRTASLSLSYPPSKEGSPLPDTQSISLSQSRSSQTTNKTTQKHDYSNVGILAESFALSARYGSEYMDDNPLIGEPGSFIIQRTRDKPAVTLPSGIIASTDAEIISSEAESTEPQGTKSTSIPILPPLKTDLPIEFGRKGKGGEKSPLTPGGGKKRKKGKVLTPKTPK